ncbi:MAG: hypothetical protein QNK37_01510 [Acidobacteriota bacterium]|nr:hypothetical protein [Acidobacteriota bacterium]
MSESNNKKPRYPKVFDKDEMNLVQPRPTWTRAEILGMEGIFLLKDVADLLGLDSPTLKRHVEAAQNRGESPWDVVGAKKVWSNWVLRMKVFAPYYRKYLELPYRKIDKEWDANVLLEQRGHFLLSQVCKLIPFNGSQMRYLAKRNPKAAQEFGIWKDEVLGAYIVDMGRFSVWIKQLWQQGTPEPKPKKKVRRRRKKKDS